ncbi:MAG: carbonic anhydrase [Marinilabiliaceae bacterium]|nr:carbonic anhydrase [Marinilabiliaceae bacterium]
MDIQQIFRNNKKWIAEKLRLNKEFFKQLSEDQNPDVLYIGCCDSRVPAEEIMGVHPGQIFVHRNIANMVPNTDLSTMSVINYAILHLQVKHIVVCGHYDCGGIKAAMQPADLGILNPWLRNIRDVYRLHKEELSLLEDDKEKYDRLVELNVQEQCVNVIKTAEAQNAIQAKQVTVHGWVFNLKTGQLVDLNIDFDNILKDIMDIYRLS